MDIVYATGSAVVARPGGGSISISKGSHWPSDDPIVLAQPTLFTTDARYGLNYSVEPDEMLAPIEQATAAPGERRNVRRG